MVGRGQWNTLLSELVLLVPDLKAYMGKGLVVLLVLDGAERLALLSSHIHCVLRRKLVFIDLYAQCAS